MFSRSYAMGCRFLGLRWAIPLGAFSPEGRATRQMPEFDPLDYRTIAKTVMHALLAAPPEPLPPAEEFNGAGVYAIYYDGAFPPYAPIRDAGHPIYVGKAVPPGARRGGADLSSVIEVREPALFKRLKEHSESIEAAENLSLGDFRCRFLVVTAIWVSIAETLLINKYQPLWNKVVAGFGNHDPGSGRYNQQRSDWDVLHPGRGWAGKLKPGRRTREEIIARIEKYAERYR